MVREWKQFDRICKEGNDAVLNLTHSKPTKPHGKPSLSFGTLALVLKNVSIIAQK